MKITTIFSLLLLFFAPVAAMDAPSLKPVTHQETAVESRTPDADSYQCQFPGCGFAFTASGNLRRHVTTNHTGLQLYACPIPNCKKFYTKGDTQKHMAVHHKGMPNLVVGELSKEAAATLKAAIDIYMPRLGFTCHVEKCNASFLNQKGLNKHCTIVHSQPNSTQKKATRGSTKETGKVVGKRTFDLMKLSANGPFSFVTEPKNPHAFIESEWAKPQIRPIAPRAQAAPSKKLECWMCEASFSEEHLEYLKRHIYLHMISKVSNTCPDCKINFTEIEDFADHLKKYHKKDIQMPQDLSSADQIKLNQVIAQHLPKSEAQLDCPACADTYYTQETLEKHYFTTHTANQASKGEDNGIN